MESTSDANEILPKTVKFIRREIGGKSICGNGRDQVILVVVRFRWESGERETMVAMVDGCEIINLLVDVINMHYLRAVESTNRNHEDHM